MLTYPVSLANPGYQALLTHVDGSAAPGVLVTSPNRAVGGAESPVTMFSFDTG